jgi:methylated-DNA-[protein]-cysteine S-methyltransferase
MRAELTVKSPLGPLTVTEEDGAIVALRFGEAMGEQRETPLLVAAATQLDAYFYCGLKHFDLKLAPRGSDSECAIWALMNAIPFGETRSYGEIARAVSDDAHKTMPQEVGLACGRNPIPIIQPCHRVLAAGGALGGFSAPGGVETKLALLRHEGAMLL